jgi:hypothetical protein
MPSWKKNIPISLQMEEQERGGFKMATRVQKQTA